MSIEITSINDWIPGLERVMVKPDIDDRETTSGVFIQGDDHEQESGTIVAVSKEAADAGYCVGDRIIYSQSSREVFKDKSTGEITRVLFWQSIAAKSP